MSFSSGNTRRIVLFALVAVGGLLVGFAIAQAASGTPKGKLAKVEQQLAQLQTETGKIGRLLDSDRELHPRSERIVVDHLAAAVDGLKQVQSDLSAVRAEIKRPRNSEPAAAAGVQRSSGSEQPAQQPASWTFSGSHDDHDYDHAAFATNTCDGDFHHGGDCGGLEQIEVVHKTFLHSTALYPNGYDASVPFPGGYEIAYTCAPDKSDRLSRAHLIVDPTDRDVTDNWNWVIDGQAAGTISARQYESAPRITVFCEGDWTVTFTPLTLTTEAK